MVEHSAVNRVVVGSSPTRGGSPIGLDNLDSHAMSVKVDTRVRDVIGLARDEREEDVLAIYISLRETLAQSKQVLPKLRLGPSYLPMAT